MFIKEQRLMQSALGFQSAQTVSKARIVSLLSARERSA